MNMFSQFSSPRVNANHFQGAFPGPTIEARSGDTLVIEVHNGVEGDDGISVHWHGMHMRGANHMDGVASFTQSAIPSGDSFTYTFQIAEDQAGTFWYHAHSEVHRGDGLFGGLVVHKPADEGISESLQYGYDEEVMLLIGDWYHRTSEDLLHEFMSMTDNGEEVRIYIPHTMLKI